MLGYFLYSLLVLAGFGLWLLLFLAMRRWPGRSSDIAGLFLIRPLHVYLRKRGYSFTQRKLVGWGAVLLLMLLAPLFTWLLEH